MTAVTRTLARYAVESRFDALPEAIRHEGVRAFVNWLGCVLGGCREAAVDRALAALEEFSGPPQATVIGRGRRLDVPTVALLNTISNFAHSYNDTHLPTVGHPNGPPAAAAFALAERWKTTGAELVHALVLGTEVACRLSNVITEPPARCHPGLSTHGVTNGIGTAVAAGKLLRLDERQMTWAIGLAVQQAAGTRSAHSSMASHLVSAHAARCGVISAFMAAKGYTCSEDTLESSSGFAAVFANLPHLESAVDRLGQHYEITANAYKPYPAGIVNHAPIDACLQVAAEPGFDATAVQRVELRVHPRAIELCDRPDPQDQIQALVSVQHWAAVALLYRAAGLAQGTDRCVRDPAVAAMRRRVAVAADPGLASDAACAAVVLADGSVLRARIEHCRGSLLRPMSDDDLGTKFLGQAKMVLPMPVAEALLAESWCLRDLDDAGALASRYFAAGDRACDGR